MSEFRIELNERKLLYCRSFLFALALLPALPTAYAKDAASADSERLLQLSSSKLAAKKHFTIAENQRSKSDDAYSVQGKAVTKQQYQAAKLQDEGIILLRTNANEQALQKFKQSIELYDGYAEVHHSLALTYAKLGNKDEAIKELKRALELNPNLRDSWILLGGFLQSSGRTSEAVSTYQEYVRRFPSDTNIAKVNATLGLLYAKLGKSDVAIDELKHSIEQNPESAAPWLTLGGVYQAKGDLPNAIGTYQQFCDKFPHDAMIPKVNGLIKALTNDQNSRMNIKQQEQKVGAVGSAGESGTNPSNAAANGSLPEETPASSTTETPGRNTIAKKNERDDYLAAAISLGAMQWPRTRIPITVYIADGSTSSGYRESFRTILKRSFEDWARASSGQVSFIMVNTPAAARLKCFWTDKISDLTNNSEAGETKITADQDSIKNVEIVFLTVPLSKSVPLSDNAFRQVALHELGHALGMRSHSSNPEDIMFYSTTLKDGWRELSGRDSRSITKLYQSGI
jgi:tetratricopeptide (TPR) repeat protein